MPDDAKLESVLEAVEEKLGREVRLGIEAEIDRRNSGSGGDDGSTNEGVQEAKGGELRQKMRSGGGYSEQIAGAHQGGPHVTGLERGRVPTGAGESELAEEKMENDEQVDYTEDIQSEYQQGAN